MIRIAIMKEAGILRDGIQRVIETEMADCRVSCYSPSEFTLLKSRIESIDLLLLDMGIDTSLIKLIDACREKMVKVAVWISEIDYSLLKNLFKKGLDGYFYDRMSASELIVAIQSLFQRRQYIHPFLSAYLLADYINVTQTDVKRPNGILSDREWEIMEHVVQGKKNCEIAESLYISAKTVKNHLITIFKKLNVTDRTNAALLAVKNKWLTL